MSSYYYRPKIDPILRAKEEADIKGQIEAIHFDFPTYGYRRIHEQIIRSTGEIINEKKIRRIMKKYDLRPVIKQSYKIATTDSNHVQPIHPNLIQGMMVNGIDQVWVADITYIRLETVFIFLSVIMDLYSRKIIGWAISRRLEKEICLRSLKMAINCRNPPCGVIHHSDRGVQYASNEYVELLFENKLHISMSDKGNPYDNAFCESLMKTLKYDEIHLKEYETITDVIENLPTFIEKVYNKKRLHSSLGYLPPEEFEAMILTMRPEERPILKI